MNILIVGNGFDLSHYLPTKYEHFIGAMNAIENWVDSNHIMFFDHIYDSFLANNDGFISQTKRIYRTENIKIKPEQI